MAIRIIEIHPADPPEALNTEWFVLENQGTRPFLTRGCNLVVRKKGGAKKTNLGTMDPGFSLAPGEKKRVTTGHPGRKSHGQAPEEPESGGESYSLFLNESILHGPGCILTVTLRSLPVAKAVFDPEADSCIAPSK